MPTGNTSLHARSLARAQRHDSIALRWGDIRFSGTLNWEQPEAEGFDRNSGDNTPGQLTCVVSSLPSPARTDGFLHADNLPVEGDIFTDAAGFGYRVASIDYAPALPKIVFHIPNVITP